MGKANSRSREGRITAGGLPNRAKNLRPKLKMTKHEGWERGAAFTKMKRNRGGKDRIGMKDGYNDNGRKENRCEKIRKEDLETGLGRQSSEKRRNRGGVRCNWGVISGKRTKKRRLVESMGMGGVWVSLENHLIKIAFWRRENRNLLQRKRCNFSKRLAMWEKGRSCQTDGEGKL